MGDFARKAQHYHDLALECLVLEKITTAIDVRENYRKAGQYYLAKAGAELTRAKHEALCDQF
jgi:hypothetical protein